MKQSKGSMAIWKENTRKPQTGPLTAQSQKDWLWHRYSKRSYIPSYQALNSWSRCFCPALHHGDSDFRQNLLFPKPTLVGCLMIQPAVILIQLLHEFCLSLLWGLLLPYLNPDRCLIYASKMRGRLGICISKYKATQIRYNYKTQLSKAPGNGWMT